MKLLYDHIKNASRIAFFMTMKMVLLLFSGKHFKVIFKVGFGACIVLKKKLTR
jgi:hypothetical protein